MKGFYKYVGDTKKIRENVGPLVNKMGDPVTQDVEKVGVLNAFLPQSFTPRLAFRNPRR